MRFFLYSNQHFLPPASCCKSWFIHFEQGESLLIILSIPWTQRHTAVCSAQSELFVRLLLKNTVCRVQIVAWTQRQFWKIWGPPIFQTGAEMWSELPHWTYHLWRRYIAKTMPANKGNQTLSKLWKLLASWSSRVFRFFKQACSLDTIQELSNLESHLKWGIDLPHHHRCSLQKSFTFFGTWHSIDCLPPSPSILLDQLLSFVLSPFPSYRTEMLAGINWVQTWDLAHNTPPAYKTIFDSIQGWKIQLHPSPVLYRPVFFLEIVLPSQRGNHP